MRVLICGCVCVYMCIYKCVCLTCGGTARSIPPYIHIYLNPSISHAAAQPAPPYIYIPPYIHLTCGGTARSSVRTSLVKILALGERISWLAAASSGVCSQPSTWDDERGIGGWIGGLVMMGVCVTARNQHTDTHRHTHTVYITPPPPTPPPTHTKYAPSPPPPVRAWPPGGPSPTRPRARVAQGRP